jgi:hypothetical protein
MALVVKSSLTNRSGGTTACRERSEDRGELAANFRFTGGNRDAWWAGRFGVRDEQKRLSFPLCMTTIELILVLD